MHRCIIKDNLKQNFKMDVYKTILKRRTIRRFKNISIPYEILEKCVDAGRLAPSASNLQPCEYIIVDKGDLLKEVFNILKWAAYISPKGDPPLGERPKAYIVVLVNKNIRIRGYEYDVGAAVENIILAALEEGIGSCCMGSINRNKLRKILDVPNSYAIDLIVALGYPNESPVEEELKDSIKYWKDENEILHVPKRKLIDILHRNTFDKPRTDQNSNIVHYLLVHVVAALYKSLKSAARAIRSLFNSVLK